jgi:uncharacterized MAPEG superfamily protein
MTTDLWMLVATAVLCVSLPFVYLAGRLQIPGGLQWGLGNRDTTFETPAWVGRAQRAHANLVENMAPFVVLVLVAHVAGKANGATALGASLFFWGRLAHAAVYTAGIVGLRTAVFAIASIGEILILVQLFR